ncbi:MAG: two-component system, sensor histidine kinase and response regulator [Actinomycetota bacterium]|nr:two-component system, sensor histidine kinase and response regulator [Actinomycetota bacterium]
MNEPVLIVDDNPSKRLAIRSVLDPVGYTIVEAESGLEALRCVMARDFAVILLDVRMPVMDGFETAAMIRLRWQSEMTPIIFVTAVDLNEMASSDRYAEGAVDFMSAPVQPEELRAKVAVFASLFTKAESLATQAAEVQTSADRLRLVTDAAPIGIFQTDAGNRYTYTNPRWSEITGIAADRAAGQPWDSIIPASQRRELIGTQPDRSAVGAELCHRFELRPPRSGEARIVLVTSKAIVDADGGAAGWVGTLADVTAEAGAEAAMAVARDEANEASRLKSDFLANMSHEIRTPMNGVIGMTDLLLETELDPRQRDYAQTVRNSGEALLTIIDNILDFSKVEAGMMDVEKIPFAVRGVVDDVVDLLAGPAQTKGLELMALVADGVPAVVSGDPGRVRQVLTNLVGNAIKFTQEGEIVVRVTEVESGGPEALIRFDVSDTGDGIEPDKLGPIFQPFAQADTSTSRRYGGTGLGLAISSQLISLMGGDCGVSSQLGKGSTFWFTVFAHDAVREMPVPEDGLADLSVLVVDDSATQRGILSKYLDGCLRVSTASSGQAALGTLRTAAIQNRPFQIVVVDRTMPGMDGGELRRAIAADPSLDVRVVLMTDLAQDPEPDDPTVATISKPVHRDELRRRIATGPTTIIADVVPNGTALHAEPEVPVSSGVRLLLAEDNLINQKVAVEMLSQAGYTVDTVLNGAAAVEAFKVNSYDAVLMDCQMPELNGYEATAAIRAREGAARHTPIIAMTAGARREDRQRCLAAGMDGYLAKPVSKDALIAMVRRSVGEHPAVALSPMAAATH